MFTGDTLSVQILMLQCVQKDIPEAFTTLQQWVTIETDTEFTSEFVIIGESGTDFSPVMYKILGSFTC